MGTPNFAVMNASKHFVVLTGWDEEYRECPECEMKHYGYDWNLEKQDCCSECDGVLNETETEYCYPEDFEADDLKQNLYSELEKLPYDIYDTNECLNSRPYPSYAFAELVASKTFGDAVCEVKVICFMTSGYYEGATLDWKVEYCDGADWMDSFDDIAFENGYNTDMNEGMSKIQTANAQKWAENMVDEMIEKTEAIYVDYFQSFVDFGLLQGYY